MGWARSRSRAAYSDGEAWRVPRPARATQARLDRSGSPGVASGRRRRRQDLPLRAAQPRTVHDKQSGRCTDIERDTAAPMSSLPVPTPPDPDRTLGAFPVKRALTPPVGGGAAALRAGDGSFPEERRCVVRLRKPFGLDDDQHPRGTGPTRLPGTPKSLQHASSSRGGVGRGC